MTFDLTRFVQAQDRVIEDVRRELRDGRKRTHWMWFVFPQLHGLGRSAIAQYFAISSLEEAEAYLGHLTLGPRLIECTELVNAIEERSAYEIFASPDDLKFHSCMTLFSRTRAAPPVFQEALDKYFAGALDEVSTSKLAVRAMLP